MGQPAIVANDRITGTCAIHQIPDPSTGAPQLGPPMPFSAPLTGGHSTDVRIGGRLAAIVGSTGIDTTPHVGLHASDPFLVPTRQEGRVMTGSATVTIGGQPAAHASSNVIMCSEPGSLVPTVTNVLIG